MAADPYVLTIAEVHVDGRVTLASQMPADVTVAIGQELHVNVRYRLREANLDKEAYRFRLASRIGDQQPPEREQTWHDRPVLRDQLQGFIGHRYKFDRAGDYTGEATVLAQYITGAWGTRSSEVRDEASGTGTLRVTVR